MDIIQFKDVWEMYKIKFIIDGKGSWENFWALKGITFNIEKGETVGIIGENGVGKSTILKLIAGILKPNRGEIKVEGRVSGLLELGAGFQPELTGRDNIRLIAGLFGLGQAAIEKKYDKIADFAGLGKFIHAPVKCYSQGMFVRLAFAIAIHMEPDILLIDDTLAVGDEYFQRKCIKKIFEIKEQGKTIIFVTHDMNMLRRLCKRVLFLREGRIVKDDLVDEVIPLYAQMVGTREGIGILEKGQLRLIFNNGRLFLNWRDKLLTPDPGAYTTFLMGSKWYNSFQADWEVKKETEKKLVATGKFYQLALVQVWGLEIINNYRVKLDIEIESQEPVEIQEGCTNVMLTSDYTDWFTTLEKGDFPRIDDRDRNWQGLLEGNDLRRCIGVGARDFGNNKIPSLAIEQAQDSYRSQAQISNTDYLAHCRVLQYKALGLHNYSATQSNSFVYFSGALVIDIPDINGYLERLHDDFVLSNGRLKVIFNNGQCLVAYDDMPVTKANHIIASININGKRYLSDSAHWEVKKEKKDKLVAKGFWRSLPISQIWEIELNDESGFLCKVNLVADEDVDIQEQSLQCMCHPDYIYWFSEYAKGSFPAEFLELHTDMTQRCIGNGPVGLQSQNSKLPTLTLNFSKMLGNFAKVFNSNFYHKARILQVEKVEPEQSVKFPAGTYPSFALGVFLSEEKKVHTEDLSNILERGRLKFVFDNGKGRIYWGGRELTKRLGLYTSLRSQGRWHDSASSAIWKTEAKTNDAIEVSGKWLHLPIHQYWELRLISDELIEFAVSMKVDNDIETDRLQTNIMLSERYSQWFSNDEKRIFPQFNPNIDDDWQVLWSGFANSEKDKAYIGVEKNSQDGTSLPTVIFSPQEIAPQYILNIVNSDIYHRGRVLQYIKKEQGSILTGEYVYYRGKIEIKGS